MSVPVEQSTTVDPEEVVARPAIPLLINDKAGALRITAGADQIAALAREVGLELQIITTKSAEDSMETIEKLVAEGVKRVAVAGGDGTIACAAQALACTNVTLGILPQGTANNFATALRLPQDLSSALRVLKDGVEREVDLGQIGTRYFTESAGVGLFADAMQLFKPEDKNILHAFWTMFRVFVSARARRVRLYTDGQLHTERAVMVEVANSFRIGYGIPVAPEAKLTDGMLDVVVVGDLKGAELLPYLRAMRQQLHRTLPKVQLIRAKEVRIESRHKMNVHCDDSVVGTTPAAIKIVPRALRVLVDRL